MYVGEALNVCYEEYKKEGEEIVFVCVISGPKPSVTERSIRCSMGAHPTTHSKTVPIIQPSIPAKTLKTNNNPIVVHRTPTVRSVLWFRQGRLGRCL